MADLNKIVNDLSAPAAAWKRACRESPRVLRMHQRALRLAAYLEDREWIVRRSGDALDSRVREDVSESGRA